MGGTGRRARGLVGIALIGLLSGLDLAAAAEPPQSTPRSEDLHFRWRFEGVTGVLSRLLPILPPYGDGVMALRRDGDRRLRVEFTATSEKAADDDYWKYETAVDLGAWHSLRVRETLHYGKRRKTESFDLAEHQVLDVLSGLQQLRYEPPGEAERRTVWSGGKVYPVMVTFKAYERREFENRDLTVKHLSIRGIREPGRRFWKSRADLWISDDEAALPIELLYHQALGRLRLTLVGVSARRSRPAGGAP